RSAADWPADIRRLPAALAATPGEALADAAEAALGRVVFATNGTAAEELSDPAFVEKLLRVFDAREALHVIAFAEGSLPELYPWRLVDSGVAEPHGVAWRVTQPQRVMEPVPVNEDNPIGALVRAHARNQV